jgi:hypothetical protein
MFKQLIIDIENKFIKSLPVKQEDEKKNKLVLVTREFEQSYLFTSLIDAKTIIIRKCINEALDVYQVNDLYSDVKFYFDKYIFTVFDNTFLDISKPIYIIMNDNDVMISDPTKYPNGYPIEYLTNDINKWKEEIITHYNIDEQLKNLTVEINPKMEDIEF